jgi:molybdate transport system substrate-binding protein
MRRLLTAVATAALLLTGCAAADDTATVGDPLDGPVVVFAAASLKESFTAIGAAFERDHPGVEVTFNFGASSTLARNITQGAPADVFAAASPATMRTVTEAGDAADPEVFARNQLEIAVPAGNPAKVTGLADLGDDDLKIALCARQVPCGAAAVKAFEAAGLTPRPDTYEQDVKAALAKVILGEVDAALVYRTDVRAAGAKVEGIAFPESARATNDYPIVTLTRAPNAAAAAAFVTFVRSDAGRRLLTGAGFAAP